MKAKRMQGMQASMQLTGQGWCSQIHVIIYEPLEIVVLKYDVKAKIAKKEV